MSEDARTKIIALIEKKYGKLIDYIAKCILKDDQLAEDVKQEVLWEFVSKHEDKFELPPDEMKNYLCMAARNTAINMAKKNAKRVECEQASFGNIPLEMDRIDMEAFQDKYGFGLEAQELLLKLDNTDKDILSMKYGLGYSTKEISDILKLSQDAVKKRIYRARIRLQNILFDKEGR